MLLISCRRAPKIFILASNLLSIDSLYRNTPIFVALVTYAESIKQAQEEGRVNKIAVNKYDLGLVILEQMQHLWQASSWAYSLFKLLADKDFLPLRRLPRASRWQSPDTAGEEAQINANHSMVSAEDPPFNFELLQEINPFLYGGGDLDAMIGNDLFNTQNW
jgi:hypothetical protein